MRILIVDDHAVVRKGLAQLLEEGIKGGVRLDEAAEGSEALRLTQRNRYDLILLDISLPGQSGLEILKQITARDPHPPVLILSMHPEEQYALRGLRAGAAGYLTKQSAPEELLAAVDRVLHGGKYLSTPLSELLAGELGRPCYRGRSPHEELSDREFQILCMIGSGKTITEIAAELSLSVKTVSTYRSRLLEKMNMKSNADIIGYAVRERLVE